MRAIKGKKLFAILIVALLTGLWIPVISVRAQNNIDVEVTKKNEEFTLNTEYGIDGWAVYDNPVAMRVTIECKENFIGTLRVTPQMDYGMQTVAYGEDISLTAGEAKTFTIVLSSISSYGKIQIEVLNEKNKVVYGETNQVTLENIGNKIAVGVLSDDYSALSYFDGLIYNVDGDQKMTSILELTKDSIPEDSNALSALQYIVIDNFDTAQLSSGQYEAIKDWTRKGGVLILALGSNYQNVLHCFQDDFVTGTIGGLDKQEVMWSFGASDPDEQDNLTIESTQESDSQIEENPGNTEIISLVLSNVDCVDFELVDGEEMTQFAEGKVAYQKHTGKGNVVVLSYSLGMEPIVSYEEKENMAYLLLQTSWVDAVQDSLYGSNQSYGSYYDGFSLAKSADASAKPSTLLYAIILIAYAIIVGPVLYLILKGIKKREKIWVAIPVVALAFTGIIYLTGFIYRVNKPLLNTFALINLDNDVVSENIYTSITCPQAKEYTFNIDKEYYGFRNSTNYNDYGLFYSGASNQKYDYMVKNNGDGMELTLNNEEAFEDTTFTISKTGENNIGSIDCDLKCYTSGFEGTVTNNTCYDLTGIVVTFETWAYQIEELKKGEQVTIDMDHLIDISMYDAISSTYYNYRDLYNNRERYMNYLVGSMMENYVIDKEAYNQGYVWANIGSYKPDMMSKSDVKQSGLGVLYQDYKAEYEDIEGVYYPNIDRMALATQGNYDNYDRMMYDTDVTITYSFENYPGITSLTNLSMIGVQDTNTVYRTYANVYAFNPETGDYEQIFVGSDTISGDDLAKYMDNDLLLLKYELTGGNYATYIPKICAEGDE